MPTRRVRVGSTMGLHARPAATFTRAVRDGQVPVTIARVGGAPVNAASILAVLGLAAGFGEEVELSTEGAGAHELLDRLAALVAAPDPEPAR
jgi:phosphocarrier protein HPr